jgi:hypothetical protein
VGVTAPSVLVPGQKRWGRALRSQPSQLRLRFVPPGVHHVRLVGLPDFDYGPDQQFAFELDMAGRQRVFWVDIPGRRVLMDDGSTDRQKAGDHIDEVMDQLDSEGAGETTDDAAAPSGSVVPVGDEVDDSDEPFGVGNSAADSLLDE